MAQIAIDIVSADRTRQLARTYRDVDGTDWRLDQHDDRAVREALSADPAPGAPP